MATHLMKIMETYLMKLSLVLDDFINDVNLLFYKQLRSTGESNFSKGQNNDEKGVLQGIRGFVKEKACMHAKKYVPSRI